MPPEPVPTSLPLATSGPATPSGQSTPRRELTLWDVSSLIVGIIIGSSVYQSTPAVAQNVPDVAALIGVWIVGALIALVGSLCYAEMASTYPQEGGDYVYLTRAFGRGMGFVYAWAQLWVVRPGSIGVMAYVFATYAHELLPLDESLNEGIVYSCAAIVLLTLINIVGVKESKWTQNILTAAKVLGLAAIFAIAFTGSNAASATPAVSLPGEANYGLAMVFVLFAYGGWAEVALVAAEVRDPGRNIVRSLAWGLGIVATVYITANLAFIYALGFDGVRSAKAVATEAIQAQLGGGASRFVAAVICISALGAIHGQIFTGARIYYALGKDHPMFARLGVWNARFGTPVASLVAQCFFTLVPVILFGLSENGFGSLVLFTTPVFYFFFLLVGLAMVVLRRIDPKAPRPYRAWGYPYTLVLFCLSSLFMLYSSFQYAIVNKRPEALQSIIIMTIGYLLSFYDPRPTRKKVRDRRYQRSSKRARGRRG